MGKLLDRIQEKILDVVYKIIGRDRIQALPGENEGEAAMSDAERFRKENRELAQKIGATQISNGDDLITRILTSLGANSTIVDHEAAKERLQTFVRSILEQNNLDTRYWGIEDIKKMITVIKGSGVIERENIISINDREGVYYGIGIEPKNGSIQLQISDKDLTKERYFFEINESGNLSVTIMKYEKDYLDYELSELIHIEYDNKGIEQKREEKKWELDDWKRRKLLSEHVITVRHATYPFIAERSVIVSNGMEVEGTEPQFKLLDLNTVNSLENLENPDISFKGAHDIDKYYMGHKAIIDAKCNGVGIDFGSPEVR